MDMAPPKSARVGCSLRVGAVSAASPPELTGPPAAILGSFGALSMPLPLFSCDLCSIRRDVEAKVGCARPASPEVVLRGTIVSARRGGPHGAY